jgi:hypothetical protein
MGIDEHHVVVTSRSGKIAALKVGDVFLEERAERIESGRVKEKHLAALVRHYAMFIPASGAVVTMLETVSMDIRT